MSRPATRRMPDGGPGPGILVAGGEFRIYSRPPSLGESHMRVIEIPVDDSAARHSLEPAGMARSPEGSSVRRAVTSLTPSRPLLCFADGPREPMRQFRQAI